MSGYRFVQWIAVHRFGVAALLGAVAVCPIDPRIANAQTAFPSCTFDSSAGGYQCTIAAGSYTQPVQVTQGALTVTNSGLRGSLMSGASLSAMPILVSMALRG